MQPSTDALGPNDAIPADVLPWHFLDPQHRPTLLFVDANQLGQTGFWSVDDLISEDHRKWLITHQVFRAQHRVSQPQRFRLAHVAKLGEFGDPPNIPENRFLPVSFEIGLQFEGPIEVIFDRSLAPTGHDDDVSNSRTHRFLDRVLDERLVHQW